jgi:Helicase conserved C-terminal domain
MQESSSFSDPSDSSFSYSTILERSGIDGPLEERGFSSPTSSDVSFLSPLRTSRDALVATPLNGRYSAVALLSVVQEIAPRIPGISIIITSEGDESALTKEFTNRDISLVKASEITDNSDTLESNALIGTSDQITRFFSLDLCRAVHIGQLILWNLNGDDTIALKEILSASAKRARRPHVAVFVEEHAEWIEDLGHGYLQLPVTSVRHAYMEVGGDLTSKPSALGDFLEAHSSCSALVFCNQSSDTEFVEVMLRKRGIQCERLYNPGPHGRGGAHSMSRQSASPKTGIVIATDNAARMVDPTDFQIVINYSIPSDPEVYLHRTDISAGSGKLREVLSLVGPLDKANFHYLKKVAESPFEKAEVPSNADLVESRFAAFVKEAEGASSLIEEETKAFLERIADHSKKEAIVSFLLQEYLTKGARKGGGRNNERRNQGRGLKDREGEWQEEESDTNSRRGSRRRSDGDSDPRSEGREDFRNGSRSFEEPPHEVVEVSRLYLGQGSLGSVSSDKLENLFTPSGVELKRCSVRPSYSFVDVLTEKVDEAVALLQSSFPSSDGKSPIQKAIQLSYAVREETPETAPHSELIAPPSQAHEEPLEVSEAAE